MILQLPLEGMDIRRYPLGSILQGYGENCALYTAAFEKMNSPSKCHNGIDCFTHDGAMVLAAHDGKVRLADPAPTSPHGNGVWLVSTDGTLLTCYFHMLNLLVKTGDVITAGTPLGVIGNTGFIITDNNTQYWGNAPANHGTHLHFGTYPLNPDGTTQFPNNGENGAVDPLPYFLPTLQEKLIALLQQKVAWLKQLFNK